MQEYSPADEAGLRPKHDFIITALNIEYFDLDDFARVVYDLTDTVTDFSVKLVVYDMFHEEMRIVVLKPSRGWPGDGILGVEFGGGMVNDFRHVQQAYKELRESNTENLGNGEEDTPQIEIEKQVSGNSVEPDVEIHNPEDLVE